MENPLLQSSKYIKSSKTSISSDRDQLKSLENVAVEKPTKKFKNLKRTKSSKNLTETLLREAFGKNGSVNSSSEKKKNVSQSGSQLIEGSSDKKRKTTKFKFPKSKSSQSGKYSHIKSRYLNVFNKTNSTEKPKEQWLN